MPEALCGVENACGTWGNSYISNCQLTFGYLDEKIDMLNLYTQFKKKMQSFAALYPEKDYQIE